LNSDLSRLDTANNYGRAVGSNTAQNLGALARMAGPIYDSLPIGGLSRRVISGATGAYSGAVNEQIAALLANPARARQVLARLPTQQRLALERQMAGYAAAITNSQTAPALSK
jgi:hypothetical protein